MTRANAFTERENKRQFCAGSVGTFPIGKSTLIEDFDSVFGDGGAGYSATINRLTELARPTLSRDVLRESRIDFGRMKIVYRLNKSTPGWRRELRQRN